MKTETFACQHCGKSCERPLARGQKPKWCSQQCGDFAKKAQRGVCEHCGAGFHGHGTRFCSRECGNLARRKPKQLPKPRPDPKPKFCVIFTAHCSVCSAPFTSRYTLSTCSTECKEVKRRADRQEHKHRRRARKRSAFVAAVYRFKIYERDRWRCQICMKKVKRDAVVPHPLAPTLDHVVPLARGGTHEPANVRLAHFLCNSRRGAAEDAPQLALFG